jgi:hypothetical protein
MNVEHEMCHHTAIIGAVTQNLKEKLGNQARNTFNRFTTKNCYNRNITHNTESNAV